MQLTELKSALDISESDYSALPVHVAGFCAFLIKSDRAMLPSLFRPDEEADEDVAAYPRVACIGYALAAGLVSDNDLASFRQGFEHLSGRTFFAEGRVPRFEIDGFAGRRILLFKNKRYARLLSRVCMPYLHCFVSQRALASFV